MEFQAMVACEERHWWYRGRRSIVRAELDRLPHRPGLKVLDAGCGSGRMMSELAKDGFVSGLDLSPQAVALARSRGHSSVTLGRVERMPYADRSFDVVTCLDVLEHTPDDGRSLAELRRVTRTGGHLVLTVPAYGFLWSKHDVVNGHYRRYTRSSLRAAAEAAGWEVETATYFNLILLPPAGLLRVLRDGRADGERSDLTLTPRWLDRVLTLPLLLEAAILRRGGRLPAGLSLLGVLRNPNPLRSGGAKPAPVHSAPRALSGAVHEMPRQFVKFCAVGATNTLISLAAYVLAVKLGVSYLIASIAAFALGAVNGYSLNRIWTFRAGPFAPSGLLRYGTVQGLGLIANAAFLAALVEAARVDRILAQVFVLPIVSVLTFGLNRGWAFRAGERPHPALAAVPGASPDGGTG